MRLTSKLITLVVLLLSTSLIVEAQQDETFNPQFRIGVGAGPIFSRVDFVSSVPQTNVQGLSLGVAAKFVSEKNLGVLAELNFTQRGWQEDFSESEISTEHAYSRTLNYLELPLLTHIYFGNKNVKFILNLGPQVSYLLGDKANMNDALSNYIDGVLAEDPNYPIGIQYKSIDNKFDYGLLGGMGIEFNTPVGTFDLQGRYYFGLGDSFDNTRSSSSNFSRSAHRYFMGKLTYYFLSL